MLLAPFCRFFVNLIKKSLTICLWVRLPKCFQQLLDFRALRVADAIAAFVALFGQAAGAGDKVQGVEIAPSADVLLMDAVHWANQLHAGKIAAVQLRQHGLQLGTVEHTHDGRFHNIVAANPKKSRLRWMTAGTWMLCIKSTN